MIMYLVCLIILFVSIHHVHSNNIDWRHSIIYYGGNSSAFGYSLIMSGGPKPWLQIGDPYGHYANSEYEKDGVIWRCPFKEMCSELAIPLLNTDDYFKDDYFKKDFISNSTFLGGVMNVLQEDSIATQSIVCAPGLKFSTNSLRSIIPGACFWREENGCSNCDEVILKPLLYSKQFYITPNKYYFFSKAQGGFSAQIIKEEGSSIQILIGAPGLFQWFGGIVLADGKPILSRPSQRRKRQNSLGMIINKYRYLYLQTTEYACYLGYQVNYGYFFADRKIIYLAAGPRCTFPGLVFLIKSFGNFDIEALSNRYIHSTLEGTEIGELFGATLLVIRSVYKYDELLIGSPYHSQDRGAVYYYVSDGYSLVQIVRYVGVANEGRFGSAMINLGNQDINGYQDVAIGAPFEDDGRGVIYIFRVGNEDFRKIQKITAKEINMFLYGFGYSLAQGDIDNNGYNDLGVGSLSGHVVVIRARPIINIILNLKPKKEILQQNDTNIWVTAFVEYRGINAPRNINLNIDLHIDKHLKRAHLNDSGSRVEKKNFNTSLSLSNELKFDFEIILENKSSINYFEPLKISLHVETLENQGMLEGSYLWIFHNSTSGNDTFCDSCPLWTEVDTETNIPFTLLCGKVNQCKSDLSVNVSFININESSPIIIGSNQELILNINILNKGEPAYLTELIVRYKDPIKLGDNPVFCNSFSSSTKSTYSAELFCTIANPLINNKTLNIPFDVSYVKHSSIPYLFELEVFSKSIDDNLDDNIAVIRLPVKVDIQLLFSGFNSPTSLLFERHLPATFTQSFMVQNIGLSSFESASIKIKFPAEWIEPQKRKINFLKISSPKISINDNLIRKQIKCSSEIEYIKKTDRWKRSENDFNKTNVEILANRTIYMDCENPNIVCKMISCAIGPFSPKTLIRLDIEIQKDIPILSSILGNRDIMQYISEAWVKIENPELYNTNQSLISNVIDIPITLTGLPPKEFVESWVIALSVIAGLLILFLVTMGLIKAGFFERKKKEQLRMLKREEEIEFQKKLMNLDDTTQDQNSEEL